MNRQKTEPARNPLLLAAACACACALCSCSTEKQAAKDQKPAPEEAARQKITKRSRLHMGTIFEITVSADPDKDAVPSIDSAFEEIARIESLMSEYNPDSAVSRINTQAGIRPVKVTDEMYMIFEKALEASRITSGSFDITFAALRGVWDFKATPPRLPSKSAIAAKIGLINYRDVILNPDKKTVFLSRKGMRAGLGGIAKGYAADEASKLLESGGFPNHIVFGGGDLKISGSKNGEHWKIGIRHPRDRKKIFARIPATRDQAVVTSGDYESFFEINGTRYHHIMNPQTGYPARGCISVTVMAPTAVQADTLATGIFVMGPEKGLALAENMKDIEVFILDDKMNKYVSTGLKKLVTLDSALDLRE